MIRGQIFRISYVNLTSLRRNCSDKTKVINETLNETNAEKKDSQPSEDPFEVSLLQNLVLLTVTVTISF